MIITLTLNPCIDRTVVIPCLQPGKLNHVSITREDVGGKGVNVSVALAQLGVPTEAVTLGPAEGGERLRETLQNNGVPCTLLPVPGCVRTNIKIFEKDSRRMTELNEQGSAIDVSYADRLIELLKRRRGGTLVLSGSVCPGLPVDIYKRVMEALPETPCILDTRGDWLREGIKAGPFLIKPNLDELEELLGYEIISMDAAIDAAKSLIRRYDIALVCVSMGKNGSILIAESRVLMAAPLLLDVKSAQGAGDSMVAGLCLALAESVTAGGYPMKAGADWTNEEMERLLRNATAAAGATVIREGTKMCLRRDYDSLLSQVKLTWLEA